MSLNNWKRNSRLGLVLLILFSGLMLLPLTGFSAEKLGWETYAGIYEPKLEVLGEDRGAPGSAFLFEGTGYPPNTIAKIFVEGQPIGKVRTDSLGTAQFLLRSRNSDPLDRFMVFLSVNPNTADSDEVRLEDNEPIIPVPPGWNGPTFPLIRNQ